MISARENASMHFIIAAMLRDCTGTEEAYCLANFYWLCVVLHDETKTAKWFKE